MLQLAVIFFIVAVIAGVLGFSGIMTVSVEIAQILFVGFLILFALSLIAEIVTRRRRARPPL